MCIRKGAITAIVNKEDLKVVKGMDKLKCYQFKTKVAKHYFCSNCGIQTHNLRRRDPNTYMYLDLFFLDCEFEFHN